MLSSNDQKLEKLDPFHRPLLSKQKTSAEIINEARNALRSVRTQRPFTPREDQRKLFGPASSRTPENRPPSSFSLHASSFELADSRPISGTRLSPLELKPRAPASPTTEEDACPSLPKPPLDPVKIRRISGGRSRFYRAASQGTLLPDRSPAAAPSKTTEDSKETVSVENSAAKINGTYLTASNAIGHLKSHPPQRTYDQGFRETKEVSKEPSSHLRSGGSDAAHMRHRGANLTPGQDSERAGRDQGKRPARASSCPSSSDLSRLETRADSFAASRASLQEQETEIEVDEVFWKTRIEPLLHELEKEDIEAVCATCSQLHHALEEGRMLGRKFQGRSVLLKTLYKLVDAGSDSLSLKLAKLILALKVSRKNLLNVCKLVFKISRSEENDVLLQNDNILESLLEVLRGEDLQSNTEAFLYCMGALKFISGSPAFLPEMIGKGAVEILTKLIRQTSEDTKKRGACLPNAGNLLVQTTATLRNLADSPLTRSRLLKVGAFPPLCTVMEQYMDDKDVCTNIARIFSKLTSYHDCCAALASYSRCYVLFLSLLNKYQKKQDLVIRIVFILGNLTAKNNQAREVFSRERGSIETLLTLFQNFYQLDQHPPRLGPSGASPAAEAEDVLVKLTRVLANVAIHPRIGPVLAADPRVVDLLLTTLESKSLGDCEELVINATAALNNLSFYQVKSSVLQHRKLYVAELLLKLLVSNNMDGILEAVRVFGNLSQDRDVCNFLMQKNVHKFMIALLEAKHQDICFAACGVLLNLTVDKDKRAILKEGGGIKKLVDCLREFGPGDWQLACLVCKTLWNFSENITSASLCFGDEDANRLLVLLSSFLDEELALDGSFDQDLRSYHRLHWETEFKPVAQQLLKRIQSHHTPLEPLPTPSF
nr:armadillo repeat-containing protein 2 isoform X3 [Peromyscus maniculatus bairdii]